MFHLLLPLIFLQLRILAFTRAISLTCASTTSGLGSDFGVNRVEKLDLFRVSPQLYDENRDGFFSKVKMLLFGGYSRESKGDLDTVGDDYENSVFPTSNFTKDVSFDLYRKIQHMFCKDDMLYGDDVRVCRKLSSMIGGQNKSTKKKILILMSDTGGGHRASAQAIDQALSEICPGKIDVDIVDIWTDNAKWPFNRFVPSYRFMAKYPILWRIFYAYGRFPPTKLMTEIVSRSTCYENFRKVIESADPDMVVSVHPLCQHIPIPIVKKMNKVRSQDKIPISFVTIVTDLGGAHPTWFNNGCDICFVPSEAVRREAVKNGLSDEKIVMHGLPIRPSFWKPAKNKNALREKLGMEKDVKTVLLMGGGDGVGGLSQIATEIGVKLGEHKGGSQLVVVCGHNNEVASKLRASKWPSNVNVAVKGFVHNIDEYMGASDCLVTKAGPGTIAEAMTRGLPLILSSFLPGQEEGNVPYVVNGGFGVYTGIKPRFIAKTVFKWFNNDNILSKMSKKALEQSRPESTRLIAKDISNIVLGKIKLSAHDK